LADTNRRGIALSAKGFNQTIKLVLKTRARAGANMNEPQPSHSRARYGRARSFARNDVLMKFGLSDREASYRFVTPNEPLAHLIMLRLAANELMRPLSY
jgi:hypothetical protein